MSCNANITRYMPGKSCCAYIESGKTDFDKWDLQDLLGIKESKVYKLKDAGERKITNVVMFSEIMNQLRELNQPKTMTKSLKETANFIRSSYLSLEEIRGKLSDVDLILNNKKMIQDFIDQSKHKPTIAELIGVDPSLLS